MDTKVLRKWVVLIITVIFSALCYFLYSRVGVLALIAGSVLIFSAVMDLVAILNRQNLKISNIASIIKKISLVVVLFIIIFLFFLIIVLTGFKG